VSLNAAPAGTRLWANAALATPFQAPGVIDWDSLTRHARDLLERGLTSVTAFGTTGEGASIPLGERAELFDRFGAAGIDPARVVECVYGPAAGEVAAGVRKALGAGAAAVLVPPPFYFKQPSDDGVFAWYDRMFGALGGAARDVLLYNIPGVTGVTISVDLVARLRSAFPQILLGVKDSSGDWPYAERLLAEHADLTILFGFENLLIKAAARGGSGTISGLANIAPEMIAGLVRGCADARIDDLVAAVDTVPVVPAIKALVAHVRGDAVWRAVEPPLDALESGAERRLLACYDALFSPAEAAS
jgi:4-hydroxy-tetrahydrodipicolinate synthase